MWRGVEQQRTRMFSSISTHDKISISMEHVSASCVSALKSTRDCVHCNRPLKNNLKSRYDVHLLLSAKPKRTKRRPIYTINAFHTAFQIPLRPLRFTLYFLTCIESEVRQKIQIKRHTYMSHICQNKQDKRQQKVRRENEGRARRVYL